MIRVVPTLVRVSLLALVAYTAISMAVAAQLDDMLALQVGPVTVYLFDILLLFAVVLVVHQLLIDGDLPVPPSNRTVLFLVLAYCAYQLAVIFPLAVIVYGIEPVGALRQLEWRLSLILIPYIYLAVLRWVTTERLILLLKVAASLLALYVIYRYITVGPVFDDGTRLRQLWGGATLLFGFLIITSVFLPSARLIITIGGAALGLAGIVLTNHRSGYVALLAAVIPIVLQRRHLSSRMLVAPVIALACLALVLVASPTIRASTYYSLRTMVDATADQTARDRVDRSGLGLAYFAEHPLGDYTWSGRYYLVDLGGNDFEPHNFVVQFLSQQGIVGLAFLLGIILATMRIAWRNRAADATSTVMLAYFVFYLVFCLFNTVIINQWNVLLLAVPVGVILHRNASLAAATVPDSHVSRLDAAGATP